jgi:fructokinase
MTMRLAGIELGGTKTIAVLAERGAIVARETLPTGQPQDTLPAVRAHLATWHATAPLDAIGIASFGPIRLERSAADFGRILPTPKAGWQGADVARALIADFPGPWAIDTDVNGAALAEYRWGGGIGLDSFWYVTLGTGVGGGLLIEGRPVHGAMHPEIGHLRLPRAARDRFPGVCPFHGDCIEGLVSGPALAARFGRPVADVADDDPCWDEVAQDLAGLVAVLLLTTAARAVLFGGGVTMARAFLLEKVRHFVLDRLGGYLPAVDRATVRPMVALAALGGDAGIRGSLALAEAALTQHRHQ